MPIGVAFISIEDALIEAATTSGAQLRASMAA
jgi:hypothetical protein